MEKIYIPYLFPIVVSHIYFPFWVPLAAWIYTSLPFVSHIYLPLWVPWGAWGRAGYKCREGCRNDILYRKLKYNWDFLHLFGVSAGIIEPRRSTVNTKLASTEMQSFALGVVCWVNYCHYNESDILVLIPHIFSAHRNSVNYPQFNLDSLSYCKGRTLSLSLTISARHV